MSFSFKQALNAVKSKLPSSVRKTSFSATANQSPQEFTSLRATADRIYSRYLKVKDSVLLDFRYRAYVQGAIPQRPFPRLENVALGIEEFASKPGLKSKTAEALTDSTLVGGLEQDGFFAAHYR